MTAEREQYVNGAAHEAAPVAPQPEEHLVSDADAIALLQLIAKNHKLMSLAQQAENTALTAIAQREEADKRAIRAGQQWKDLDAQVKQSAAAFRERQAELAEKAGYPGYIFLVEKRCWVSAPTEE